MLAAKCGVAVFLCSRTDDAFFTVKSHSIYGVLFGFQGWDCPLYAIMAYENTPFSGTVGQFYLLSCALKALGFSVFSLWLLFAVGMFQAYVVSLYSWRGGLAQRLRIYLFGHLLRSGGKVCFPQSARLRLRGRRIYGAVCVGTGLAAVLSPVFISFFLIQFVLVCVLLWAVRGGNHVKNGMEKKCGFISAAF